jgi:ubiquinone/menaquinone biosynthesis C-methylase UbiE
MNNGENSLREAWQQNASEWIRWARSPRLDHAFWRLNLPALMSLLPVPGGLTLDVACGEGRVARELKRRGGYEVIGIEGSTALAEAAREADPGFEVRVGDAAAMPFPDGHFELAVASLCLMNMDDLEGVLGEIARVLVPGGALCLSVLHPVNTWGDIGEQRYFEVVGYSETIEAGEDRVTVHDTHRSLQSYFDALQRAGFLTERVLEPVPDDAYLTDVPAIAPWRDRPAFLHLRAVLA